MRDELMSEISGLRTGDRLRLITELYGIYSEYHAEPFDKFYFWGDMLLADFDTIDKYRHLQNHAEEPGRHMVR